MTPSCPHVRRSTLRRRLPLVRPPAARPATRRRRAPGRGDDARVPWSRHRLGPMGACSVRGPILDAQILAGAKAARAEADHQLLLAARLCLAAVFPYSEKGSAHV